MNIHNGADDVIESRNIRMDQSGLSIPKSLAISLLMLEPLLLEFVHFCAEKLFFRQEFMELFCTQAGQQCDCGVFFCGNHGQGFWCVVRNERVVLVNCIWCVYIEDRRRTMNERVIAVSRVRFRVFLACMWHCVVTGNEMLLRLLGGQCCLVNIPVFNRV